MIVPFRQKLNSRKLLLSGLVLLGSAALLVGGYITGDNWVNIATVITAGYMATQAWEDKANK